MATVIHVTHEAVQKAGGIGAVLQGLITAPSYAEEIDRTILLGPLLDPDVPLGPDGEVLYDRAQGVWSDGVGPALSQVEAQWGARLVYGRRRLGEGIHPEVLLVDVGPPPQGLDLFKYYLGQHFGLDSRPYEGFGEYEQYLRLAEPGFEGVRALLADDSGPIFLIAHEFMGVGTAMKAMLSGDRRFFTVFYAHEVATVRRLVEESPGHDVMFYNVLRAARAAGMYLPEVFGPQDGFFKHSLVQQAWRCDAVLAVGDGVVEELRFLGPEFAPCPIDLVYNGIPTADISLEDKQRARQKLQDYAAALFRFRPELIFTHVTRLVPSKGLWRDLLVLEHLDPLLEQQGRSAVFIVLATEVGRRDPVDIAPLADQYGWPLVHCEGYPDLVERELAFDLQVRAFNARSRAIKVLFVNQFGWDRESCGPTMPLDMEFADLRQGSDVEFGQSIYEPFGIAQIESLGFGAIAVVSDVCGCNGFVERVAGAGGSPGFIRGNYTHLDQPIDLAAARVLGIEARRQAEARQAQQVAVQLAARLPRTPKQADSLLERGRRMAAAMSWERVARDFLLPALARVGKP